MGAIRNSKTARHSNRALLLAGVLLAGCSAGAIVFFYHRGYLLYYGDAEAHLNIARRILDSRTPGYDQIGTVWLPLLHVLLMPFAAVDRLWITGLAAAFPSAAGFIIAGLFLFAATRRLWGTAPAAGAAALFALNPNLLYLQSTAMTEPLFFASLMALLYFCVRFQQTQSAGAVAGAGVAGLTGTLTRYEAWFLVPFVALFLVIASRRNRWRNAALFGILAGLGPLYWLAHNWWATGDPLAFFRGPYSAKAIQGNVPYPGKGNWVEAWRYLRAAARDCIGGPLLWLAVAGAGAAAWRRTLWPLALLLLPGVFYVWSIHSSGTPIFVPELWPHSYYNSRYGLALFPAAVFAAAALITVAPRRLRALTACVVVAAGASIWVARHQPADWITWKESEVNSVARREWTRQAARFLGRHYEAGSGVISSFGDLSGIFRSMHLPFRQVLTGDNWPLGPAAVARPDLFLWEEWAVVRGGDPVQSAIQRSQLRGPRYALASTIVVKGAPVIEIYRRIRELPVENARIHQP